jgi:hypothetical protein
MVYLLAPSVSQNIFSVLTFVTYNTAQLFINSGILSIDTRYNSNLHLRTANLNIYRKGVYYSGIKIFSSLPLDIRTCFDNLRTFKKAVEKFFTHKLSFYSLYEYYDNNNNRFFFNCVDFSHSHPT